MKRVALGGVVLTATVVTFAQAPVNPPGLTTLSGCVGGGGKSRPITLSRALMLPASAPAPAAAESAGAADGIVASDGVKPTSKTGTSASVGTAGTISGTAPAGSSASSIGGYRLSGADMSPWIGRRVQIIGTLVSSPTASSGASSSATGANGPRAIAMPEFRVVTVQPITGECPQR
jgi:hypothetical protein